MTTNSIDLKDKNSPILFLHGWGMNKMVWQDLIVELEESLPDKLIQAIDLPGYGENQELKMDYTLQSMADWLAEKITDKVTLVGWSLGGLVALQIAKAYPNKVNKIILVASSPKFSDGENWPGIKPDLLHMFYEQLEKDHKALIERFFFIQAMGSETAKKDIKKLKEQVFLLPSPNIDALKKGLDILMSADFRDFVQKTSINIHILLGKLDSLVPIAQANQLLERNPSLNIKVIDKASHAPFISHLSQVATWLRQNLT